MKHRLSVAVFGVLMLTFGLFVAPLPAGAAIAAPGVPQHVAVAAGGHQITISWSPPASGPTPTAYQVYGTIGNASGTCMRVTTTVCVLTLASNFPSAKSGTTYSFKVRAFNGTKAGAYSALVPVLFGKPTVPTGVTVTAGSGYAQVAWSASTGSRWPVTGYTVTATGGHSCTSAGTSCTVTGLSNGGTYTFSVTATNVVGTTVASAPIDVTVGTPLAPSGVTAVLYQSGAAMSFTPPGDNGSPITDYRTTAHDVTNPADPSNGLTVWGLGIYPQDGLTLGHSYTFTVVAINGRGWSLSSAPSNQITLGNVPNAPTGVTAARSGDGLAASFTDGADNGSTITEHRTTAHDVNTLTDITVWGATLTGQDGIVPGHTYTLTVMAENGYGFGPSSAPSDPLTLGNVPDAPIISTVYLYGSGAAVNFTDGSDNGSTITEHRTTAHDITNPADPSNGSTDWGAYVGNLTPGDTYYFTIIALNDYGWSASSAPSAYITMP